MGCKWDVMVISLAKSPVIRSEKPGETSSSITYHLVMTNSSPWKITIFKNGKPSISMGHLYHGYVTVITRG